MKKITSLFLCVCLTVLLLPMAVCADFGPKPSVRVRFENMGDELCYATLISQHPSTGPQSVWDGDEAHINNGGVDMEIWRAFVEYEDADGFYFLQLAWQVNERKELGWTYYPPQTFKILLYYPETDTFAVSGICHRYAFDTYYTVDMEGSDIGSADYDETLSTDERLVAFRSYQWRQEAGALAVRIVLTILVEMAVAIFFGFRGKKALLLLAGVNTVTQIVLNVLLNLIDFYRGGNAFIVFYILMELLVFAIEAVLYAALMNRYAEKKRTRKFYVIYALAANAVSFGAGIVIANVFPNIF